MDEIASDSEEEEDGTGIVELDQSYVQIAAEQIEERKVNKQPFVIDLKSKKDFYYLAVTLKLRLPRKHPARLYIVSDILDECIRLKVPKEEWREFIKDIFGIK